jgi:gas vesicle protein
MEENRRNFAKKLAMLIGVGATVGSVTNLIADDNDKEKLSNGVVVGHSRKKEIIYKKTNAWNEYYKNAK